MYLQNTRYVRGTIQQQNCALPGGLEPPTFRLTAERANQLRHGSWRCPVKTCINDSSVFVVTISHFNWMGKVHVKWLNRGRIIVFQYLGFHHPSTTSNTGRDKNHAPAVGFEPTTFGLEVQRASPLRHAGLHTRLKTVEVIQCKYKYYRMVTLTYP